jgi:RNA polymerase sigma factor (sigma-70 family)
VNFDDIDELALACKEDPDKFPDLLDRMGGLMTATIRRFSCTVQFAWRDDAEQACRVGIWKAVKVFDRSKGAFSTVAVWKMLTELTILQRHTDVVHVPIQKIRDGVSIKPVDDPDEVFAKLSIPPVDPEKKSIADAVGQVVATVEGPGKIVLDAWLEGKNLREIGDEMGLTKERVRQIFAGVCERLRLRLHALGIDHP